MSSDGWLPMDFELASKTIDGFLRVFLDASRMDLRYTICAGSGEERVRLRVNFEGEDTGVLVARNAEVLLAMESLATSLLRLAPEEHDLISFDAEDYKGKRSQHLHTVAERAVSTVRATGRRFAFPPMNSRERRMLHLELSGSGLRSESSGEGGRRFVVLYPEQQGPGIKTEEQGGAGGADRARVIRSAFRPR